MTGGIRASLVRSGLRWSLISAFMRLRISQAAAIFPAAGYALLWSDVAEKTLSYQWRLQQGAWLTVPQRLTLVYLGALVLTFALAAFYIRCPRLIRRNPAVEDAIGEYELTADKSTRRSIIADVSTYFLEDGSNGAASYSTTARALVKANFTATELRQAWAQRPKEEPRTLIRAYYLQNEDENFGSLTTTALLIAVGTIMLFIPALEVLCLVLRMLVSKLLG